MKELWKLIPGDWKFPYYVSSHGRVGRLLKNGRTKILHGAYHGAGYLRVRLTLAEEGREYSLFYVHRLVAAAFLEKPDWAEVVHHLNHDSLDNRLENLAWSTHKGNARYWVAYKNEQAAAGRSGEVVGASPMLCSLPLARERSQKEVGSPSSGGWSEQAQVSPPEVLPQSLLTVSWSVPLGEDSCFDSRPEHGYTVASKDGI